MFNFHRVANAALYFPELDPMSAAFIVHLASFFVLCIPSSHPKPLVMSSGKDKNVKKKQKHELTIISSSLHDFISRVLFFCLYCWEDQGLFCFTQSTTASRSHNWNIKAFNDVLFYLFLNFSYCIRQEFSNYGCRDPRGGGDYSEGGCWVLSNYLKFRCI